MSTRAAFLIVGLVVLTQGTVNSQRGSSATPPAGGDAIVPFKIHVPDAVLADLKQRLARTRFPEAIPGSAWDYGTDLPYLRALVTYWRTTFDWRAAERRLNQFDQFKTNIDGLEIHFIHQRSSNATALPLVLTHGWPGSVVEFTKIIGPLTDPAGHGGRAEDAFHVVAISLPGFGFSGKPVERGYGPERIAAVISKLMARLGYSRYAPAGRRLGQLPSAGSSPSTTPVMSRDCTSTSVWPGRPPVWPIRTRAFRRPSWSACGRDRRSSTASAGTSRFRARNRRRSATRWTIRPPDWRPGLSRKFRSWCDCGGDVEKKFTKDDLLTNITLYWATETATSSARIYYENQRAAGAPVRKVTVPTACAVFPKEISIPPRRWVEASYNLTRWTEMPRGGHFAALEEPELLVDDLRAFFRSLR